MRTADQKTAEEILREHGCENAPHFTSCDYATAIIGVTFDGRVIYDYELMIEYLMSWQGFCEYEDCVDWIDYNVLRTLPYMGDKAPIIAQIM